MHHLIPPTCILKPAHTRAMGVLLAKPVNFQSIWCGNPTLLGMNMEKDGVQKCLDQKPPPAAPTVEAALSSTRLNTLSNAIHVLCVDETKGARDQPCKQAPVPDGSTVKVLLSVKGPNTGSVMKSPAVWSPTLSAAGERMLPVWN